ncbi:cytochrome P450 [Saccharothrix australiensis]|uniref:cytochrome P450 n=1 Tax=Saccharothrix australiensis TaxID=2072 RepID=UPI001FE92AA8|nr:cytochrome P450 [Saccharothrix australiensis]
MNGDIQPGPAFGHQQIQQLNSNARSREVRTAHRVHRSGSEGEAMTADTAKPQVPTVPGRLPLLGHTLAMVRGRLAFTAGLRSCGDLVRVHLGSPPVYFATTPELAHQVLSGRPGEFTKGVLVDKLRSAFGNGLVSTGGDFRRRRHRLIQPALRGAAPARHAEKTTESAVESVDSWRHGQRVAVDRLARDFAISVVGRTLFSADFGPRASAEIRRHTPTMVRLGVLLPAPLARPVRRRFDRAVAGVHGVVDAVLGRRATTFAGVPSLVYTQRVIKEVLRKCPRWLMMRRAATDVTLGGVRLPAGAEVGFSPHALHHDPLSCDAPEVFDPDRWLPLRAASVPGGAYVPFAGGLHQCPGHACVHRDRHRRRHRGGPMAPGARVGETRAPRGGRPDAPEPAAHDRPVQSTPMEVLPTCGTHSPPARWRCSPRRPSPPRHRPPPRRRAATSTRRSPCSATGRSCTGRCARRPVAARPSSC